jgi:aryl-alcohol dehydrogenase-like predicted oxidoreductase
MRPGASPRVPMQTAVAPLNLEENHVEYRQLGRTGLQVSALTLGTMTFGGRGGFEHVGTTDRADARRIVDRSLDAGINLIDTADVYSSGLSEEILGSAIEGRRDRLLVATKARFRTGDGPNDEGLSRHHLIRACEASLRRLGIDHIDLYQTHEWDGATPIEETTEALDTLVRQGKVRYLGCSNFSGWHLMKALATADRMGAQRYASQQINYSLQAREAEYELIPAGIDQGVGVLVWSPLAGGLLSGKYRSEQDLSSRSRQDPGWNGQHIADWGALWRIVGVLVEVGDRHGVSAAQVALAWLLGRPGVTSVIIGARSEEQLADNLAATELLLDAADHAHLAQVSRPPLLYPYWHQSASIRERMSPADHALHDAYLDGS